MQDEQAEAGLEDLLGEHRFELGQSSVLLTGNSALRHAQLVGYFLLCQLPEEQKIGESFLCSLQGGQCLIRGYPVLQRQRETRVSQRPYDAARERLGFAGSTVGVIQRLQLRL